MADWYISSAAWTAIPQFTASHAYSIGDITRPLTAPALNAQYAFRCTTAGTSSTEPSWSSAASNGNTVTSGGATFTNVAGQSTYGWGAAAGNLYSLGSNSSGTGRLAVGDRAFVSSDHSESGAYSGYQPEPSAAFGIIEIISVNRAGSVPPVAGDALSGAAITYTGSGTFILENSVTKYWQGITFTLGGSGNGIWFGNGGAKGHYFKNCAFVFTTSSTTAYFAAGNPAKATLDNTTVSFNAAGQRFALGNQNYPVDFTWINTPSATLGTVPTVLFALSGGASSTSTTCRGVDLSAVTTTLFGTNATPYGKVLLDSCKIASGAVRYATTSVSTSADEVELVNCYDGTNFLAERHTPAGDVTTEFTFTLSGGATDNVGVYSHKMVSSSRSDKFAMTLDGFWMDVNNTTIGSTRTATVQIISSASLNTDEITLVVEYQSTSGSSLAAFATSFSNVLTTPTAITTSTATWNSSPSTPVKQQLSVSFVPQTPGRVRAQVRLGKPSTTCYYNPQLTLT